MGDLACFLARKCCSTDIFNVLECLDCTIKEVRGDNYCATAGATAKYGNRLTLSDIEVAALLATELTGGGNDTHVYIVHLVQNVRQCPF